MYVKELYEKFKLNTDNIPNSILNIELMEDVVNFKQKEIKPNIYSFEGKYVPNWMEDNTLLEVKLTIDLSEYDAKVIGVVDDIDKFFELELSNSERKNILSKTAVTLIKTIPNNFYSFTTYNILGGLISIS